MTWSDNARLLYAEDYVPAEDLAGYHGLVAKIGENFTDNVQSAYDAEKPCILFADHKILKWHVDFGFNQANWPPASQEPLIQDLDRMIYSGGVKRVIHAIILNGQYVTDEYKTPLTYNWWTEENRHMLNMIYARYQLPIYFYTNKDPVTEYWYNIEGVYKLVKDFGVSVVDFITGGDYPPDDRQPWRPFVGPGYEWYFWLYTTNPLRFLYNGTPEELYEVLNFKAGTIPPDDPPPNNDPLLERIEELERWAIEIDEEKDQWMDHILKRVQALEDKAQSLIDWKDKPL